ncbi:ketosynthase chain-length factor [Kitasatospora sp. NPDC085464]|uniref:ketosynthase chain-length factor n=1 Tax=Kitasatospora sp. NPDC085464 TaxID=3364063 RepID=UPI0037C6DC2F
MSERRGHPGPEAGGARTVTGSASASTPAVVTGIGIAAPNGLGTEECWRSTLAGTSGIGPISRFDASGYPVRLAGEVPGFEVAAHVPSRLVPQTDRMTQLALAAADWALADAGVDPQRFDDFEMGVVTANSSGGFEFGQKELEQLWANGPQYVSAYQSFAWFYAVNTGQLSIRHGMCGPSGVTVAEQAGGLDALGQARRQLSKGIRLVLTGGMDASLCPWGLVAQLPSGLLSEQPDPQRAFLPFDTAASGQVLGEGGAILVMEPAAAARERGAPHLYGEIAGYCATFDPRPGSGRPSRLLGAMRGALDAAGLTAEEVDVVFADASGVPESDRAEAEAVTALFGPRGVPVTAPKTMFGRLSSGGAPVDVALALLALRDGVIPPSVNITAPVEEYRLDLVTEARPARLRTALVVARGAGGFNTALVVRAI